MKELVDEKNAQLSLFDEDTVTEVAIPDSGSALHISEKLCQGASEKKTGICKSQKQRLYLARSHIETKIRRERFGEKGNRSL
ncbi:MAG: hypothetical protein FWG10_12025 [Eubacteriaceae bacterium]|nr:hypothetical protein [Eubacteriaceae bacterium]